MRFFWVRDDKNSRRTGYIDAVSRWMLPSIACDLCGGHGGAGEAYPTVDLSDFPERSMLEEPQGVKAVSLEGYERLCQLLRPLVPPGAPLEPGTFIGPSEGKASGRFGDFHFMSQSYPFIAREALEKLQAEGVRGLKGGRPKLRYRGKNPPEMLDMELQVRGHLHPMCFPETWREPCHRCGSRGGNSFPLEASVLRASTLPEDIDIFRLHDFKTIMIANERFVDAVKRLQLNEIAFIELPAR